LLLQETFPSWLYSVNLGATTIWEHWDGINEKGELWSKEMNSFNHYALGAVGEWMYEVAVGINQEKDTGGFEKIVVAPHPNKRLGFMEGSLKTAKGKIYSKWSYGKDGVITYEIEVPDQAKIIIGEKEYYVEKGKHVFYQ
jgi:alpha-L-rhamnosidase